MTALPGLVPVEALQVERREGHRGGGLRGERTRGERTVVRRHAGIVTLLPLRVVAVQGVFLKKQRLGNQFFSLA